VRSLIYVGNAFALPSLLTRISRAIAPVIMLAFPFSSREEADLLELKFEAVMQPRRIDRNNGKGGDR